MSRRASGAMRSRGRSVLLCAAALLAGCGPPFVATEGLTYTVQRGDTLYAIAWRLGKDLDTPHLRRLLQMLGAYQGQGTAGQVDPLGRADAEEARSQARRGRRP